MTPRLNREDVTEGLTTMVLAIHDDRKLSGWFETLKHLSAPQRQVELFRMRRMLVSSCSGDADEISGYLALLADDRIFAAALLAYRSL